MGAVFCEWGLNGIHALADRVDVFVIVDVLSFSTAVDVVVSRGASVYPFPFGDHERAKRAAAELGAILAKPRRAAGGGLSLSIRLWIGRGNCSGGGRKRWRSDLARWSVQTIFVCKSRALRVFLRRLFCHRRLMVPRIDNDLPRRSIVVSDHGLRENVFLGEAKPTAARKG